MHINNWHCSHGFIIQVAYGNGKYNGWYVAQGGLDCAYTKSIIQAKNFKTRADAEREACGNETIIDLK